ncbi:class I SAM-dependent methyltransferase [Candidatus Desantisbacteria bacterium]|nr:class I SAM-dependent methyltransferase [Candidatus Desantisbacteria bacterium]
MDYRDYQLGATKDFFWHKAKNQLIEMLLNKLKSGRKLKILNLGAGTGEDLPVISKFGEVYVIDVDSNALNLIPEHFVLEKKVCDACHISYPDDFFDSVVAFDVLEHIEDDRLAVNEIYRVLKLDGFFIFTVPAFNFLYSSHDRALKHFRRYDKRTIKNLLLNLKCIESGYWVFSLFLPVAIQRIMNRKETDNPKIHFMRLPIFVNNILCSLLKIENWLIKHHIPLPVGTSIYGIYQKEKRRKNVKKEKASGTSCNNYCQGYSFNE